MEGHARKTQTLERVRDRLVAGKVSRPAFPVGRDAPASDHELMAAISAGGDGPFVAVEYVALPGDRVAFVATDPKTGICCFGRDDRELAEQDAQALNAAYALGKEAGREMPDEAVYAAYEQIRMTAIPGGNGHLLVPDTAIAAMRAALYPEVRHG